MNPTLPKMPAALAAPLLLLLAVLLTPGDAHGQAVPGEPLDTPINVSASVNSTFGAASILSDSQFTQTDFFLTSTSLGINYMVNDALSLSVGGGISKYLTRAGGTNEQFEMRLQDVSLSASLFPLYIEQNTGIITTTGISLDLPTSAFSRAEGLYTSVGWSLTALKPIGGMILVYSFGVSKNFHRFTSQTFSMNELDIIVRDGGAEQLDAGRVAIDGVLPSFSIRNSFVLIYNFAPAMQFRANLAYSDAWTYDNGTITRDDEFVNENAVVGRGHRQSVVGGFGLRFLLTGDSFFGRGLSASVGATTAGTPLTADNAGLRFPFWDFENGQATRTSFNMGLSATF